MGLWFIVKVCDTEGYWISSLGRAWEWCAIVSDFLMRPQNTRHTHLSAERWNISFLFLMFYPSSHHISPAHACAKNFSTHFYGLIVSTFDDWSMLTRVRQVDGRSLPKSLPRAFLDCSESWPAQKFYECNSWTLRTCEFAMERRRDFALAAWIEKR